MDAADVKRLPRLEGAVTAAATSASGVSEATLLRRVVRLIEVSRERIATSKKALDESDGLLIEMDARNADPAPLNLRKRASGHASVKIGRDAPHGGR